MLTLKPIAEIAEQVNIPDDALEQYGRYKGKIDPKKFRVSLMVKLYLLQQRIQHLPEKENQRLLLDLLMP